MNHASLFSGIGGPEVAAAMLGWENVFHCEINPFGRRVLEYWFPNSESYEDITKTNFTKWRGRVDILTGGFPCQPFSYAGKRGGREDERYLWPQMLRAINEIRPTWVIGENVAGITTMVEGGVLSEVGSERTLFEEDNVIHGYELEQSFTIERICRDLERAGYSVQPVLIPAAAVGAPHRRDRIFILAHVADADCGDDVRGSGEDEGKGKGKGKGLSERHQIRKSGESDKLRSETEGDLVADTTGDGGNKVSGEQGEEAPRPHSQFNAKSLFDGSLQASVTPDTECQRLLQREHQCEPRCSERLSERGSSRDVEEASTSNTVNDGCDWGMPVGGGEGEIREEMGWCGSRGEPPVAATGARWASSDSDSENLQRRDNCAEEGQRELQDRPVGFSCGDGDATNSHSRELSERVQRGFKENPKGERSGMDNRAARLSDDGRAAVFSDEWLLPENRWRDFPTVSPVHRGNDGLCFNVDDLTIPFSKWRTESLKAYGNAICVQVAYRIFQAIEQVENGTVESDTGL